MRHKVLLLFSLATGVALAQAPQIHVSRAAYPYEVIDSIPEGVDRADDRASLAAFLAKRNEAQAGLIAEIEKMCPGFLDGDWSTPEVAIFLDQEAKWMVATVAAAYDEMIGRLSLEAIAAIHLAIERANKSSADTRMVDVEESSPDLFGGIVRHMCGSE